MFSEAVRPVGDVTVSSVSPYRSNWSVEIRWFQMTDQKVSSCSETERIEVGTTAAISLWRLIILLQIYCRAKVVDGAGGEEKPEASFFLHLMCGTVLGFIVLRNEVTNRCADHRLSRVQLLFPSHLFLNIYLFALVHIFHIVCTHCARVPCTRSSKTETFYRSELEKKCIINDGSIPHGASSLPCCLQPSAGLRRSEVSFASCSALLKLELTDRSVPVHTTRRAGRPTHPPPSHPPPALAFAGGTWIIDRKDAFQKKKGRERERKKSER